MLFNFHDEAYAPLQSVDANTVTPCGRCYFSDGKIEEISFYIRYSNEYIVFRTTSGFYEYRSWAEPVHQKDVMFSFFRFCFYKIVDPYHEILEVARIDKIEIFGSEL